MAENAPQQAKTPHILFVGKTAIDFVPVGTEWHGFFSGNAAHAALAATYGTPDGRPVRISAVTTLGAAVDDDIHAKLREMYAAAGIEVFSHPDAHVFGHVYLPSEGSLRNEIISRRYDPVDFAFEPLSIPGVSDMKPDVVVIGGSFVTDPRTSHHVLNLAEHFKDSLILTDLWSAPEDASTMKRIISLSHTMKMSQSLLLSTWGDNDDPQNEIKAVRKVLKFGNRAAVITGDERVEFITYWKRPEKNKIPGLGKRSVVISGERIMESFAQDHIKRSMPVRRHFTNPHDAEQPLRVFRRSVAADEILTGALARAYVENNITPQSLREGLLLPNKFPDQENTAADPNTHNSGFIAHISGQAVEMQRRTIGDMDKRPKDRTPLIVAESRKDMIRLINGKHLTP